MQTKALICFFIPGVFQGFDKQKKGEINLNMQQVKQLFVLHIWSLYKGQPEIHWYTAIIYCETKIRRAHLTNKIHKMISVFLLKMSWKVSVSLFLNSSCFCPWTSEDFMKQEEEQMNRTSICLKPLWISTRTEYTRFCFVCFKILYKYWWC